VIKMKRTSTLVLVMAFVVALFPVSTYAQTATETPTSDEACATAKKRISTHASAISVVYTDHSAKYATMKGRIDTLVSSATKTAYTDISSLTAARDTVSTALSAYNTQSTVYTAALETAQAATCGEEQGEFTPALTAARTELVTLRDDAAAVKASIIQNAAPALRNYATWLKANTTTTEEKQ